MAHHLKVTDLQLWALDYKQMASLQENLRKNIKPEAQTEIFESYHVTDIQFDRHGLYATTFFKFSKQYLSQRTLNLKANKLSMILHLEDSHTVSQIFIFNIN